MFMTTEHRTAHALHDDSLAQLFLSARTHSAWQPRSVDVTTLQRMHDLARMAPTGGNAQPARFVFVQSAEAKDRLRPALHPLNVDKTMTAPVTAIVAGDTQFHTFMPKLFPARPELAEHFAQMPEAVRAPYMLHNTHMQAAYLIMAARAVGLDCGPVGGFDKAKVDAAFFAEQAWESSLLINLGYGDGSKLFPRNPRLDFAEACVII
jgi:3-hydroxypropanoate dehydrogenase